MKMFLGYIEVEDNRAYYELVMGEDMHDAERRLTAHLQDIGQNYLYVEITEPIQ